MQGHDYSAFSRIRLCELPTTCWRYVSFWGCAIVQFFKTYFEINVDVMWKQHGPLAPNVTAADTLLVGFPHANLPPSSGVAKNPPALQHPTPPHPTPTTIQDCWEKKMQIKRMRDFLPVQCIIQCPIYWLTKQFMHDCMYLAITRLHWPINSPDSLLTSHTKNSCKYYLAANFGCCCFFLNHIFLLFNLWKCTLSATKATKGQFAA